MKKASLGSEKTGSESKESISGRDVNKSEDELVSSGRLDSINVTETILRFKNDFFKKVFESQERLTSLVDLFTGDSFEHIELMNVIPIIFGSKENEVRFKTC